MFLIILSLSKKSKEFNLYPVTPFAGLGACFQKEKEKEEEEGDRIAAFVQHGVSGSFVIDRCVAAYPAASIKEA